MENIVARLNSDYSQIPVPKDFIGLIHKTLGALIKTRKVYYTGKGYFLVVPDTNVNTLVTSNVHRSSMPGQHQNTTDGVTSSQPSTREINGFNSRPINGYKSLSPVSPIYNTAPRSSPSMPGQGQPRVTGQSPSKDIVNTSTASEESESSQQSPSHLERSQSFKMSRKAQKTFAKGGSLRLSKKEVVALKEDSESHKINEEDSDDESPKKMERKGSVLGRLFGRKKSSNTSPKKEILTFSAQFPPPDLLENLKVSQKLYSHSSETQTPPAVKKKPSLPARPPLASAEELKQRLTNQNSPHLTNQNTPSTPTLSTSQVRNGPSGNFVVFERNNRANSQSPSTPTLRQSPLSPSMSQRPLPQSPAQAGPWSQPAPLETNYGVAGHIYSQPSHYGSTPGKPPPPAYSHAPPYRATKDSPAPSHGHSSPAHGHHSPALTNGPLPMLQLSPATPHKRGHSQPKQVHFAATPRSDRSSPLTRSSPGCRSASSDGSSTAGSSSVSGPSSIDSGQAVFDDTLVVIEKSNQELEQRLGGGERSIKRSNRVDTIHNNNRVLDQEIIFEESSDISRSSSVSTLKPNDNYRDSLPDHPSLADMGSIADLSAKFQSLTARKLMAGLSISSIDTLLEVNAAHDPHKLSILNESTETIDFGVI